MLRHNIVTLNIKLKKSKNTCHILTQTKILREISRMQWINIQSVTNQNKSTHTKSVYFQTEKIAEFIMRLQT